MKNFRLKGFISILLCLVMVIGLSGSVMVKAEEDKKIVELSAEYTGTKDESGDVLVGTALKTSDFKFQIRYDGEEQLVPLPDSELSLLMKKVGLSLQLPMIIRTRPRRVKILLKR